MMGETSSVSKGCFIFKKTKSSRVEIPKMQGSFGEQRYDIYNDCIKQIDISVKELERQVFSTVLEDVVQFITSFHLDSAEYKWGEVPAAALLTGVNISDHSAVFDTLEVLLLEGSVEHTVRLTGKQCGNLKLMVQRAVSGLINNEERDEVIKEQKCTFPALKAWYGKQEEKLMSRSQKKQPILQSPRKQSLSQSPTKQLMEQSPRKQLLSQSPRKQLLSQSPRKQLLSQSPRKQLISQSPRKQLLSQSPRKQLIEQSPKKQLISQSPRKQLVEQSPRKRHRRSVNREKPLVIILEDAEAFNCKVLQDFILICSEIVDEVPIVLVLGFALGMTSLHTLLSQGVASKLSLKRFHSQSASTYLNEVICKVMLSNKIPVKLGGKSLRLLLDMFYCHDFAVSSFLTAFKLCVLEHYSSNPYNVICCNQDILCEAIVALDENDLENLRNIPSFRAYCDTLTPNDQRKFKNDFFLKSKLEEMIIAVDEHHYELVAMVRFLHSLAQDLPSRPLGEQMRELYCRTLEGPLAATSGFAKAMELVKFLSRDELISRLERSLDILAGACSTKKSRNLSEFAEELMERISKIKNISQLRSPQKGQTDFEVHIGKHMNRHQLQEKLLEAAKEKSKKLNPYAAGRDELIDFLKARLSEIMQPPTSQPLHEVIYFDSTDFLKFHIIPAPRVAIQTRLIDPGSVLKCSCCTLDRADNFHRSMPDLCIAYKLQLEYGHLINLYDWLQAFISVVSNDPDPDVRKPDPQLHARFIQAVSELQLLGFVKPTKRKTDHMVRLTWSSAS